MFRRKLFNVTIYLICAAILKGCNFVNFILIEKECLRISPPSQTATNENSGQRQTTNRGDQFWATAKKDKF